MRKFQLLLILIALCTFSVNSQVNLDQGLVAHYPFDGNNNDISGNNNNGTSVSNVNYGPDRFNEPNKAVAFGGTASPGRVDVTNDATLQFTTAATFSFWMRVNSATGTFGNGSVGAGGSQCPFTKNGDQGGGLWHLVAFNSGSSTLNSTVGNVSMTNNTTSINPYALNNWIHFTYVMDATETRVYVNGVLNSTTPGAPNFSTMNNRNLSFGRFNTNWYPFNGSLDDFRIYNRTLNQQEITALSNAGGTSINITSLSSTTICAGSSITANFTAAGTLAQGNQYQLQLSNSTGDFTNPLLLGSITSTSLSGSIQATLPAGLPSGTNYRVRIRSTNIEGISTPSNTITINGVYENIPDPALFSFVGSIGNRHFYLSNNALTWSQAQTSCQANGGHLAVIPDAETNNLLASAVPSAGAFFALNDAFFEGVYEYITGDLVSYYNWNPDQPDNASNEDFGEMQGNGGWNDRNGTATRRFFLQLAPAGIATQVCEGTNINFSGPSLTGASFAWSGPNAFNSIQQNPVITNAALNRTGTYTLTTSLNGCSASASVNITMVPTPLDVNQTSALLPSLNTGRVLHYPMDANANDVSGNNFNGTLSGGVTAVNNRFGAASSAFLFNGSNGHITAPSSVYFDGNPFSVTAWANPTSATNFARLFDFGNGQANQNILLCTSQHTTGRPYGQIYSGTTSGGVLPTHTAIANNRWSHIAFTWENGTGAVYLNGILIGSAPISAPVNIVRTINRIARSNWPADAYFNGRLDDFRIYNRRLSLPEIFSLLREQPNGISISANPTNVFAGNASQIILANSQAGISYQLQNDATAANIGAAVIGTGDTLVFPTGVLSATTTFRIVATSPLAGCQRILSQTPTVTVGSTSINISNFTGSTFCAGTSISINFTASGEFQSGNRFTLQLSNALGNFDTPIVLGQLQSTSLTGSFQTQIPTGAPSGAAYRLRIISSNQAIIGASTNAFTINGTIGNIPDPAQFSFIGSIGGRDYFLSTASLTWTQARTACQNNGGFLATVPDSATNAYLVNATPAIEKWIGLNDESSEGLFVWSDGSLLPYINWNATQPDNANNEDYVELLASGRWNDRNASFTRRFILQLGPAGVPQENVCLGSSLTLGAATLPGASYLWNWPNGFNSTTQNALKTNVGFDDSGIYTVTYTLNGCSATSSVRVQINPLPVNLGETFLLPPSLSDSLQVYLPMNGNATDASENNINGTLVGGVTPAIDRFGVAGGALSFNGSNGHVQMPSGVYFNGSPFTVSSWVRMNNNANWSRLFDFGNGQANNNVLLGNSLTTTGRPSIEIYRGTTSAGQVASPTASPTNQWMHITYVWENGCGRIYRNGQIVAQGPQQAPLNVIRTLNYIGRSNWNVDAYFLGRYDDFRIYNRALSLWEIRSLYLEQPVAPTLSANPTFLCSTNPASIRLANAQPGISYQMINSATLANIAAAQTGRGDTLTFSTGSISAATSFAFVATSPFGACNITTTPPITVGFGAATPPSITANGSLQFCNGQNVVLSVPAQSGIQFQWQRNGANIGTNSNSFTATLAGTYTVQSINPCGTVNSANSIVITISGTAPAAPTITAGGATTICEGQNVTLSVPTQTGVTYQWKRNNVNVGTNNNLFTATLAGNYTVTLISSCGETVSTNSINVVVSGTLPTNPLISASGPISFCSGQSVELSVSTQSGVQFQWQRNGINVGTNSNSFVATLAGTYTVQAISTCGTVNSTNSIVVAISGTAPAAPTITAGGATTICEGQNVTLSVPTQTGVTYQWKRNNVNVGTNNNLFTATLAGNYTVTLISSCGETVSTNSINVVVSGTQPSAPLITAGGPLVFCSGSSVLLSIAPQAGVNYQWKRGAINVGGNNTSLSVTESGNYTIELSNSCGTVVSTNTIAVTVNPTPPTPQISASGPLSFCQGSNVILSAPVGASSYSWSNGASSPSITVNSSGTFSVQITQGACQSAASPSVIVEVNTTPLPPVIQQQPSICAGAAATVTAQSSALVQWFSAPSGGTPLGSGLSFTTDILNESLTLYAGAISGVCVSASRTPVNITVQVAPGAEVQNVTNVSCAGANDGSIIMNVVGPSSFQWNTGQSSPGLSNIPGGEYVFTALSSNGCSTVVSVTVIEPLAINISGAVQQISCLGLNTGAISIAASGGSGLLTYSWSNGSTVADLSNLEAGAYSLTVSDNNGCEAEAEFIITPYQELEFSAITTAQIGLEENGTIDLSVSGGVEPFTFNWNDGQTSEDLSELVAGIYSVTVTDAAGCAVEGQFVVDFSTRLPDVLKPELFLAPNPAQEVMQVGIRGLNSNWDWVIFDATGRKIQEGISASETTQYINVSNMSEGIYFIRITTKDIILTRKFERSGR